MTAALAFAGGLATYHSLRRLAARMRRNDLRRRGSLQ